MENLLEIISGIKVSLEEYDSSATVNIRNEDKGYRLKQTLKDRTIGIMLFFPYDGKGVVFNNGWKMDKNYLANINDFIIELLNETNFKTDVDCTTLFTNSKSYQHLV